MRLARMLVGFLRSRVRDEGAFEPMGIDAAKLNFRVEIAGAMVNSPAVDSVLKATENEVKSGEDNS